jgi:large subunit ribosomal protein L22e
VLCLPGCALPLLAAVPGPDYIAIAPRPLPASPPPARRPQAPVVKKTKAAKVVIDCSAPVADKVLAAADFVSAAPWACRREPGTRSAAVRGDRRPAGVARRRTASCVQHGNVTAAARGAWSGAARGAAVVGAGAAARRGGRANSSSSSASSPAVVVALPAPVFAPPHHHSGTLQQKFLAEHIKIANKTNNLGDAVKVDVEGAKVVITTSVAFPKRYFKYLAKKYLKKNQLREYLRVIASSKAGYELRYFQLGGEGDEE